MIGDYLQICSAVEREFSRNRQRYGHRMRCGPGCSDCCNQLFQITEVEAAWVSEGMRSLPWADQEAIQARAHTYLADRESLFARHGRVESWGGLLPAGQRLPCPALADGRCLIYEHRPLICRKFGMPLYNPDRPGQVFACELNFRAGDAIEDGELVQIQTGIHEQWRDLQRAYNDQGGWRDPAPITVARALLEDFRMSSETA